MDIEILNTQRLNDWAGKLKFPPEAIEALQEVASLVREETTLRGIFTELHQRTALRGEWHREWSDLPMDPLVQAQLGERTSLFYLLAYMAALPYTQARYRQLGVGMDVFFETMRDFLNYLGDFYDLHGYWGYAQFMWIWRHLTCELFRLGRLQYMLAPFRDNVHAFQRKPSINGNAEILLMADPDLLLRADGFAYGSGNQHGSQEPVPEDTWTPEYEDSPGGWRGHPISPYGSVQTKQVFLPRAEWEQILHKDDTVLDLHIPREDPLNVESCSASLRQAAEFFPRVFPERPWKAWFCHTWFFTPQLQTLLPSQSSIVQFQREFYLYPYPGSIHFLWGFTFGEKYPDPATAPRDTFLRRAVLDWISQGKEIFDLCGVMFHPPEEWGTQPYMRAWDRRG